MELPDQIEMKAESFGDGKNGYAQQVSVNKEFGIRLTATRQKHGAPWVRVFTAGGLPGQTFKTAKELAEAMKSIESSILDNSEMDRLLAEIEEADEKRKESMPDQESALTQMLQAYLRLKELGWRDAVYCPKDGTMFEVIEAGSTGIHECNYQGEWPNGSWWVYADGDACSSRPILFRRKRQ